MIYLLDLPFFSFACCACSIATAAFFNFVICLLSSSSRSSEASSYRFLGITVSAGNAPVTMNYITRFKCIFISGNIDIITKSHHIRCHRKDMIIF